MEKPDLPDNVTGIRKVEDREHNKFTLENMTEISFYELTTVSQPVTILRSSDF